jgi:SAM-dependent methyltransferase
MNDYTGIDRIVNDKDLYEAPYFGKYYLNDPKRDVMYQQEIKRILKYYPNGGTVLDVGCGVGNFLSKMDDRWIKYGVEPSDFAKDKAVLKNITLLTDISYVNFDFFDVVVFRGSLQHINFPMASLVHATRSLKKGGLLVILATPDSDSLVYKIFGNLPALDKPRNWVLFGNRFLRNILQRLGFQNIKVIHPYFGTPYANPQMDFIKFFISLIFGYRKFAFPGNQMEIYAIKK